MHKRALAVVVSLLAFSPESASFAQTPGNDIEQFSNYRVGMFSGAFIPNSGSWNGTGAINGLPIAASGDLSLSVGYAAGGFVGYSFGKYFNIDLELAYASSNLSKFNGTVSLPGIGSFSGSMPLNGSVHSFVGFLNLLITPFGAENALTPYIGAGPGFASSTAKLHSFGIGATTLTIDSSSSETDFAFDIAIGFDWKVARETLPQLELGLGIEYSWIDAQHLGSGGGIVANSGPMSAEIVGLVLEYRF